MPRPTPSVLLDGPALEFVRKKKAQTLTDLAKTTGYSLGYLNDLEKGRRGGNPQVVTALAQALGVPTALLERRAEAVA